jgi:transposase
MLAHDLRAVLRLAAERDEEPSAAVLDRRTLRSTPESGARAGWNGHKRTRGSKLHLAVDTLGHLLALHVTPASENDRAAVAELAEAVQDATGESVEIAYVDPGYTGDRPAEAAAAHGIRLEVVSLPEAKRGFVLLPRRWVAERSFAWMARCRRLARDYERLPETLAGLHLVAFVILMLRRAGDFAPTGLKHPAGSTFCPMATCSWPRPYPCLDRSGPPSTTPCSARCSAPPLWA